MGGSGKGKLWIWGVNKNVKGREGGAERWVISKVISEEMSAMQNVCKQARKYREESYKATHGSGGIKKCHPV